DPQPKAQRTATHSSSMMARIQASRPSALWPSSVGESRHSASPSLANGVASFVIDMLCYIITFGVKAVSAAAEAKGAAKVSLRDGEAADRAAGGGDGRVDLGLRVALQPGRDLGHELGAIPIDVVAMIEVERLRLGIALFQREGKGTPRREQGQAGAPQDRR